MKLRINAKLRAALIAAIATVGFTLPQAQAEQQQLTLQSTDKISVTDGVGTMTGGNSWLYGTTVWIFGRLCNRLKNAVLRGGFQALRLDAA